MKSCVFSILLYRDVESNRVSNDQFKKKQPDRVEFKILEILINTTQSK